MFTGIVEEIGTVRQVVRGTRSSHFVIAADKVLNDTIIPHTAEETTLLAQKVGDTVNLECDMIGKYVERLLHFEQTTEEQASKTAITSSYLAEHGFL